MGKAEVKLMSKIYDGLYDYESEREWAHFRVEELAEQFDELMKGDEDFHDDVIEFVKCRGDALTSDRECAAYMVMYEYCM